MARYSLHSSLPPLVPPSTCPSLTEAGIARLWLRRCSTRFSSCFELGNGMRGRGALISYQGGQSESWNIRREERCWDRGQEQSTLIGYQVLLCVSCFQEQDPNGIFAGGIKRHRDESVESRSLQACDWKALCNICLVSAWLWSVHVAKGDTESSACASASQWLHERGAFAMRGGITQVSKGGRQPYSLKELRY